MLLSLFTRFARELHAVVSGAVWLRFAVNTDLMVSVMAVVERL